ncbi:MAG: hypothetical protein FWG07_01850 [Treponema sp.]|nr:hypothetical protein [Treponema sp.]
MVQITKPDSLTQIQKEDTDIFFSSYQALKEAKTDAKDNLQILISLFDSTNKLCRSLERLDNLVESIIFNKEKETEK